MPKRPEGVPEILPVDKNLIQNGDTFDIMRLDGLDPMIAFAMGAATGHTAIALWQENEVKNQREAHWDLGLGERGKGKTSDVTVEDIGGGYAE